MQHICNELKSEKFARIMIEATSNHKNLKVVPILIRYFNPKTKVQLYILEITNLKDGTADILTHYIMEIFNKYKLSYKIIAFSGNNYNTNIGPIGKKQKMFFHF